MQPESLNPSEFRPVRRLGRIVGLAIVAGTAVSMVERLVTTWGAYARIQDLVAGKLTFDEVRAAELGSLTAAAVGLALTLLGLAAVGAGFLVWLWRARVNAELASPMPHRLSRGWTIGGWFVPVANWWLPAVALNDIARASDPQGAQRRVDPIVAGWWGSMALSSVIGVVGSIAIRTPVVTYGAQDRSRIIDGAEDALSTYLSTALVNTVSGALILVGAGLIALLVNRISDQQTAALDRPFAAEPAV